MPSQQQHIKMALSIDASGIVKRLPKHSTVYDTDYLSDDEKKDGGSSSLYNFRKSPSSPLLAEQRPSNHQTADVLEDSFSSMNSDELVQQIQKVVGGTPFASNLDNSINTISSHRDRNCFQVDDTSFSSIDGIHDNSATLLVAKSPSDLTPSASFWCHKLLSPEDLGELPVLNLPKDLMVDSAHTNSVQQKPQKLSSSQDTLPHLSPHPSQRLELLLSQDNLDKDILAAAKKLQTTPMILYLSAFEILLKRWTGEDDFVLGLTTTVKKSKIIDDSNKATTGLPNASPTSRHVNFASARITNTLPIRLKGATADRPVIELIQLRDAFWREASSSHMQCSPNSRYNTISEEIECNILDDKRNVALFQVLLDYVDNSSAAGSYHAKWAPAPCTERHPLRVTVLPHESKMILQFSTTLWTTYLANVFLQNFETLLHSLVQCVQQANSTTTTMTTTPMCSTIRILPDKQLEFLRRECYGPIEIWPEKPLMHQWFEQAADDNPNGIALKIMQQEMTYREVETRSNKLARYLVENLGVEVEDIVAILMPRGFDQIIALLAVLKAGAAYVPCDMTYPKNRIETIMDDAGSFVCLTVSTGMETAGTRGVDIHQKRELIDAKEGSRLNTMVYLDNLAYVLYTSGSTGKPKGVEIEHNTVANYGNIVRKRFGIKEDWRKRKTPDRILMTARISWDASLESLMLAFTNRSTLCLIPSEFEETLVQNIELIATEMRVTRMSCAPGFSQWMDPDRLKHIQLLIFGGDVLTPTTAEAWQNGNVTTLNSYGPTEATCCITDNLGIENAFPGLTSVPLGKPYDNTVTLILDKNRQLCPPGVPGECYITGDCLARGYRNLPEVTNKAFVHNPFDDPDKKEGETRMYKTGDLVSILPDGQLNFIGRIQSDSSYIKLRGYRIELGEIMAALDDHPIVTGSIAIPDMERQKLLAFVTVKGASRKEAVQTLLDHCLDRLVDYMVPDRLMVLNSFPLDANGKIDRKMLIRQSRGAQHSRGSLIQAESTTERKLTKIFARSLGVPSDKISVHDNFFDLGGHSLLAASAVSSIREEFNTEFGVRDFFGARTIKDMARLIDGHLSPNRTEKKKSTSSFMMRSSYIADHDSPDKTYPVTAYLVKLIGVISVSALVASCFVPSLYFLNGLPWSRSQDNATYLILMMEAAFFSFVGSLLVVTWLSMNVLAHGVVHSRTLRPGTLDFLRWYIADQLWRFLGKKILLPVFGGTLWLSFIYRLFGANIGRGVFIEDTFFRVPKLVVIGDFVAIQSDAVLENIRTLPNGVRVFGKVTIRDRVVIGCRSVLSMGCRIGKFSIVKSVSHVPRDSKVPPHSVVSGTKVESQDDTHIEERENICGMVVSNLLWHIISPLLIHVAGLSEFVGMICVAWGLLLYMPLYAAFVFLVTLHPIYLAIIKLAVAVIALLFRRVICCGRMEPSEVLLYSTGFYRCWAAAMAYQDVVSRVENTIVSRVATKIMGGDVDLHSLYTSEPTDPELCVLGRNIFVANGVKLRNMDFSPSGIVRFGRVVIRDDCMLMDRAVIAEGSILGKGVTIGVLTPTYRTRLRDSSLYVGNPPFEKASVSLSMKSKRKSVIHKSITSSSLRQMDSSIMSDIVAPRAVAHHDAQNDDIVESVTIARSIFEYLMIGYGSLLSLEAPVLAILGTWFYVGAGAWIDNFYIKIGAFVAASPIVGILIVTWMMMSAILVKKLLVGDFSTFVGEDEFLPETHLKVFRWRLTYLLVCDAKKFLQWVDNYGLTRLFWRWMGVKVGKGVMIHPEAYMYETDLLYLDDGAQVDEMATLFCHTFRTRHLELKPIYVGAGASVGINSVVLPGCQIGSHVELLPLTQVFPSERIKAGIWHGNPAEPVHFVEDSV